MSKIINLLLAVLAVLNFCQIIEAREGIFNVLLVNSIKEFKKYNPLGRMEPLNKTANVGHTLGDIEEGGRPLMQAQYPFRNLLIDESVRYEDQYDPAEYLNLTYVVISFKGNLTGGQAFVFNGGVGANFVTLIVEAPANEGFLVTEYYGFTGLNKDDA